MTSPRHASPPSPDSARRRLRRVIGLVASGVVIAVTASPATAGSALPNREVEIAPRDVLAANDDARSWSWPVAGARAVRRAFRAPEHEFGAGHRGVDVAASPGATVRSPAAGVVLFAGPVAGRSVVTVDHGAGVVSSYDPLSPSVRAGELVAAGDELGALEDGSAMHCDDGCLHLGVRRNGGYVDPLPFFRPPRRSVLLPLGS